MRILGVRFKNLNSLAGEWEIDFTHPAYAADGLFAITGPTGAGKSTLMDAICLALYGSTPRLNKVTKGGNEIMSRRTGECFAEVTFATDKGRYRCLWQQHRARKRPDGDLQQSRHEIADAVSGEVLESKINQVGTFIEKATGMDFRRFTQSMLLAQGDFAAFLKASPDDRSPILEQITGTEIYSRISMLVHERRAAEQERLALLEAELKGIRILREEEERELRAHREERQRREAELAGQAQETAAALSWRQGLAALGKELEELAGQEQAFAAQWQGFAPEASRLARANKARDLEADYRSVAALREQQARESGELQAVQALLPEKEKAGTEALAARTVAENLLREAQARQAAAGETLKEVRGLDIRLDEQAKQIAERTRAIGELEGQVKACQDRIEETDRELRKVQAALDALREYRESHGADALLATQLAVIERGLAGFRTLAEKGTRARAALAEATRQAESARAALGKQEGIHGRAALAYERQRTAFEELTAESAGLLQGRDIGQWRGDLDTFKEREWRLGQAGEATARIDQTVVALAELQAGRERWTARRAEIEGEVKSWGERKDSLQTAIALQETQVALLHRIRGLEEERRQLADGRPCPLCGATEHPYAAGNLPVPDEAEAELRAKRESFAELSRQWSAGEAELAKITAELRHADAGIKEKQALLDKDRAQCAALLAGMRIEAPPAERTARIAAEQEAVKGQIAETARVLTRCEAQERQEKAARAGLEAARTAWETAGRERQEAGHRLEAAVRERERMQQEGSELAAELERSRSAVLADLKPLGSEAVSPEGIDALLQGLRQRQEAWQAKEAQRTALEQQGGELKLAGETQQALRTKLNEDLEERRRGLAGMQAEQRALAASRRELFGEKNADAEEKRLAADAALAGTRLEKAREGHARWEQEIAALKDKLLSLRDKTGQRAGELQQAEQRWLTQLAGAGFAGEADYRACRLPEDKRERLGRQEQALQKRKTELETRRQDRTAALERERERRLTDLSTAALTERTAAIEAELKPLRLEIGGIHQRLTDNEAQKTQQQDRLQALAAQQKEWGRWDDLHSLIGSADGKKFRNFAQGLTFEIMIAQANRRLREMTDRYLLIRDETQPLELNVVDQYQAGEVRSTKNLSGGESFLVSLALALGLSQMASRNVRVDSLFLDEGFGTLDEEALETALETLAGLRQDGKLIGLISHVAALKERISAQIQVTPESGGRSRLSGPGCRKIG